MTVSIIMPAYNASRYIEEAITSVLSQTFTDWELLILDDGSSDETRSISQTYADRDPRILCLPNEQNLGVAQTRNRGVSLARGQWIAFLDSDDRWEPEKLQLQLETAHRQHADFLFTGSAFMDENSRPLDYVLTVPEQISYHRLLHQNLISCSSVLIKKDLIRDYPMRHGDILHEDFAVWLQILRDKQICACGVNKPLLVYRVSSASKSGNKIKAGLMTLRVYRYLGIPWVPACFYWCSYFYRSMKKYRRLL